MKTSLPAISPKLPPGEGIRRSAGAWADDAAELDEYLEWNRQQRKASLDHKFLPDSARP